MAKKSTDHYIRFYTDGSAARQMEPEIPAKKSARPRQKKEHKQPVLIQMDPVALCSILVACVMFVVMALGCSVYHDAIAEERAMEAYVTQLQQRNEALDAIYRSGYDLQEVQEAAMAMGMVPASQAVHMTIEMDAAPQEETEQNFMQRITTFLAGLFA